MTRILIPVLLATALALSACSGSGPSAAAGPRNITVKASNLKFQPETIEVVAGQTVTLVFDNQDSVDHDFSVLEIPLVSAAPTQAAMAGHDMGDMGGLEPALHVAAQMGERATLEFTPTKPGRYEFFCTVPGHKEAGMKGTVIVKAS